MSNSRRTVDLWLTRFLNSLVFETASGQRFTQDSPVLANVWLDYGRHSLDPLDMILTVESERPTGEATLSLRRMIGKLRGDTANENGAPNLGSKKQSEKEGLRLAYLPGQIAVKMYLDELVRVAIPLTPWWKELCESLRRASDKHCKKVPEFVNWKYFPMDPNHQVEALLVDSLMLMRRSIGGGVSINRNKHMQKAIRDLPSEFAWFVRLVGVLNYLANVRENAEWSVDQYERDPAIGPLAIDFTFRRFDADGNTVGESGEHQLSYDVALEARKRIAKSFLDMFQDWTKAPGQQPNDHYLWRVTKNRPAELAVNHSALTVKADAARRLFDVSCKQITWAIVDSGIDKEHRAFDDLYDRVKDSARGGCKFRSRVIRTLDFTRIRDLLDPDFSERSEKEARSKVRTRLFERLLQNDQWVGKTKKQRTVDLQGRLEDLRERVTKGHEVDWEFLTPLIESKNPNRPVNDHGTHVAGILAADWVDDDDARQEIHAERLDPKIATRRMQGICPDIRLIDCRVFREEGDSDEFEILAAIQYLRWMNARAGYMMVHGANLSFSLVHEVRRYACGQTPICVECNEAAAVGMVMVAAAGNRGFSSTTVRKRRAAEGTEQSALRTLVTLTV